MHPNALRVLAGRGIDTAGATSKPMRQFLTCRFDYVVSLCDRVREICPEFPGHPDPIHWSVPDPSGQGDTDEATYPAFQRTLTEIETRVGFLLERIEAEAERRR